MTVIILIVIIPRPKLSERIEKSKKWVLVYGRRKTGKTFLVENMTSYDEYFFVNRNRTILNKKNNQVTSYETFIEVLRRGLQDDRTVVVDEFHRLPTEFLDLIHSLRKQGKLILITSTLYLAKKVVSDNSPLLGFFNEVKVDILSLEETLLELAKTVSDNRSLLILSIAAREPLAIDYTEPSNPTSSLRNAVIGSIMSIPALIGEIFQEEERTISKIYNGILGAVADGNNSTGKISSFLFSRKLIQKDDPSLIQGHLNNLVQIGILRKIPVINKNKFAYKISSPLMRIFYFATEKYGFSEREVNGIEVDSIIETMIPRIVEDSVREYISTKLGLREGILQDGDYDVDGYLFKFKSPEIALEVKFGKKISDFEEIQSKLLAIKAKQHLLFVIDKSGLRYDEIKVIDVKDLVSLH